MKTVIAYEKFGIVAGEGVFFRKDGQEIKNGIADEEGCSS